MKTCSQALDFKKFDPVKAKFLLGLIRKDKRMDNKDEALKQKGKKAKHESRVKRLNFLKFQPDDAEMSTVPILHSTNLQFFYF